MFNISLPDIQNTNLESAKDRRRLMEYLYNLAKEIQYMRVGDGDLDADLKNVIDSAVTSALRSKRSLDSVVNAVSLSLTNALAALLMLNDISSDDKVSPNEKLQSKQLWDAIVTEGTATTGTIPAQAAMFSVATTDFDAAYAALDTYLNTTLGVFSDMDTATTIDRTTWDTTWRTYYDARTRLLNTIAENSNSVQTTGITIDANRMLLSGASVQIDTLYFAILMNELERLVLDENGNLAVTAGSVSASHFIGDIVNSYSGSASITVDGSIQTAINNLPKHLPYDVTINVPAGTYNEDITILGFMGAGVILSLDSSVIVNGTVIVRNCTDVTIQGGTFVGNIADYTMAVSNVQNIYIYNCIISGKARTSAPDSAAYCLTVSGCNGVVSGVDFQRADTGILATYGCLMFDALTGGDTGGDYTSIALLEYGIIVAFGAHCGYQTSIPTGEVNDYYESDAATLKGTGTPTESPNAEVPNAPDYIEYASTAYRRMRRVEKRTGSLGYPYTGSIGWNSWALDYYSDWSEANPRQGISYGGITYTGTNGIFKYYEQYRYIHYGLWILPTVSNLSSITAASLTIERDTTEGSTGSVEIEIYKHALTSAPSGHDYSGLADTGLRATLARGGSETVTLDSTSLAALKAGTLKGFGLYSSGGYAQMAASVTLNVTY